jgi:hypothetical protein
MMHMEIENRRKPIFVLLLAVVCLAVFGVYHPYPYDNVVTRWALSSQLAYRGSLRIDEWEGFTSDLATYGGHYYSDKAVLPSALGAFILLPLRAVGADSPPAGSLPEGGMLRYVVERLLVGIAFLLLLLLFARLLRSEGYPAVLPVIALGLGSIMLPYSTLFYSHVPAGLLIFLSYYAQRRGRYGLSDLFGALAAAFEFPVVVLYVALLLYRPRSFWNPWRALRVPALLVLAFAPQLVHNALAFGNPLTMGYSLEAYQEFPAASRGLFGFTYPSLARLYMILLSPERGLLFYMPWVGAGLAGLFMRRKLSEAVGRDPLPVAIVVFLVLFSAQEAVTAGWSFGPRYLIPILPLLAVGLARFCSFGPRHRFAAGMLVLPGVIQALIGTFCEIHQPVFPPSRPLPLPQLNVSLEMLTHGHHSEWVLGLAGVVVCCLGALVVWGMALKGTRPTFWGGVWLPVWLALAFFSGIRDWGGRIDYLRGALAEHRTEYGLAAEYYRKALDDPGAPPAVRTGYERCIELSERRSGKQQ